MNPESDQSDAQLARLCLTVSQLNRAVAGSLQREFGVQRVRGEIASLSRAASGHWYFALKDDSAQVRCVMFRGRNQRLDFSPRDGDEVEVLANVGLYEPRGDFQLTVEAMQRFGAGRLWEQFVRLRQRLAAEGLFDQAIKRAPPVVPRAVGIVTSLQAAALRDVLATLRRRAPYLQIVVYPVPVQGAEAGARIAAMLATASHRREVQVLLLVRGGGSIEDLWAFNEEQVARAIRACALPVIVGVGHESDFTIADFAADVRAPTPTAAAELVAPERGALLRELGLRLRALARSASRATDERAQRLDYAMRVLAAPKAPLRGLALRIRELRSRCAFAAREQGRRVRAQSLAQSRALLRARPDLPASATALAQLHRRLHAAQQQLMTARRNALMQQTRALTHLNVQGVLDRGFAILRDSVGRLLTDANQMRAGDQVQARLSRGSAGLIVQTTRPHDDR